MRGTPFARDAGGYRGMVGSRFRSQQGERGSARRRDCTRGSARRQIRSYSCFCSIHARKTPPDVVRLRVAVSPAIFPGNCAAIARMTASVYREDPCWSVWRCRIRGGVRTGRGSARVEGAARIERAAPGPRPPSGRLPRQSARPGSQRPCVPGSVRSRFCAPPVPRRRCRRRAARQAPGRVRRHRPRPASRRWCGRYRQEPVDDPPAAQIVFRQHDRRTRQDGERKRHVDRAEMIHGEDRSAV